MQPMPSRGPANCKCKNKQTYGTRQHCEPSQERKVKSRLTQAQTHQVTNESKDGKSKRTKVKPSGSSLGWHLEEDWGHALLRNPVPCWCPVKRVAIRKRHAKIDDAADMCNHSSDVNGGVVPVPESTHETQFISKV